MHPRRRPGRFGLVFAIAFIIGALSGCGQKGDLYLPDSPDETEEGKRR